MTTPHTVRLGDCEVGSAFRSMDDDGKKFNGLVQDHDGGMSRCVFGDQDGDDWLDSDTLVTPLLPATPARLAAEEMEQLLRQIERAVEGGAHQSASILKMEHWMAVIRSARALLSRLAIGGGK